jgi:hypothetical protein
MSSSHQSFLSSLAFLVQFVSAGSADDCQVSADPDILGLGVRLGLYFQTASTVLISVVRPQEASSSWLPTALFFSAFFIAVIYSISHTLFPPGAIISCTWYPLLIFIALYPYDFSSYSDDSRGKRAALLLVLWIASVSLNIWFWFRGLDVQNDRQCMEPRVFFFANLEARGGIRVLFRILCLLPGAFLLAIIVSGVLKSRRKRKVLRDEERPISASQSKIKVTKPTPPQTVDEGGVELQPTVPVRIIQTPVPSVVLPVASKPSTPSRPAAQTPNENMVRKWGGAMFFTIALIFYIAASELQLGWNNLDGINSLNTTGQIIPLVIGTLSLLRTLFLLKGANWKEFWQTLMTQ